MKYYQVELGLKTEKKPSKKASTFDHGLDSERKFGFDITLCNYLFLSLAQSHSPMCQVSGTMY